MSSRTVSASTGRRQSRPRITASHARRSPSIGSGTFGRPAQARVQPSAETFKQGKLSSVSEGIARRVAAQAKVQTHDRTPCVEVGDRDPIELAALEAQKLLVRRPGRLSCIPQAQPRAPSSEPVLAAQPAHRIARASPATIARPFSRSHVRKHRCLPLSVTYVAIGPGGGPTSERPDRQWARMRAQSLLGPDGGPSSEEPSSESLVAVHVCPSFTPWSAWRTKRQTRASGGGTIECPRR